MHVNGRSRFYCRPADDGCGQWRNFKFCRPPVETPCPLHPASASFVIFVRCSYCIFVICRLLSINIALFFFDAHLLHIFCDCDGPNKNNKKFVSFQYRYIIVKLPSHSSVHYNVFLRAFALAKSSTIWSLSSDSAVIVPSYSAVTNFAVCLAPLCCVNATLKTTALR